MWAYDDMTSSLTSNLLGPSFLVEGGVDDINLISQRLHDGGSNPLQQQQQQQHKQG